jgi:hypothetical protein
MKLFLVRHTSKEGIFYVLTMAKGREQAKRRALKNLDGDPETWDVIPLTEKDAKIVLDLVLPG